MDAPAGGAERRNSSLGIDADVLNVAASPEFAPLASAGIPVLVAPRVLAAVEAVNVLAAAMLAKSIYLDRMLNSHPPVEPYFLIALCMSATLYIVYNQMGLYEFQSLKRPEVGFGGILGGLLVSLMTVLGLLYSMKEIGDLSRGWVLMWLGFMAVSIVLVRVFFVRWVKRCLVTGLLVQRIAIIGTREFPTALASRIRASEGLSGAIDLYHFSPTDRDIRFVGGLPELEAAMALRPYDRVVVGIAGGDDEAIRKIVKSLGAYTTDLLLCTDLHPPPVATSSAGQLTGIRADVIHLVPRSEDWAPVKRGMDVIVSAAALILLAPLFLIVAVAIKLETRGPVLFRQRRLGQNSSVFRIYKFRSMTVEEDGPVIVQATRNDHRVTRVGRILRSTSIDELPQLINVLLGDMSLVGPRPHAIANDHEFEQTFDLFSRRRRVKPGITGWAQVNGFRGETKTTDDVRRRMEHDLHYIENWSIWFDIEILVRTVFVVARGAY